MIGRTRVAVAVSVAVALVGAGVAWAATPKPWMWTPAQASDAVIAQEDVIFPNDLGGWLPGGRFTAARCVGQGSAVAKRYTRFRCQAVWLGRGIKAEPESHIVWLKVRRFRAGEACLGYDGRTSVPSGCLALNGARVGNRDDAIKAMRIYLQQKLGLSFIYQGPTGCVGHGSGFYRCWYGSNVREESGFISVTLTSPPKIVELRPLPS